MVVKCSWDQIRLMFKSNLYIKYGNTKKLMNKLKNKKKNNNNKNKAVKIKDNEEELCSKEDYILLINMILNANNKEFIKDDIRKILICVLPTKDLTNNIKFELFNTYLNLFIVNSTNMKFQEDFRNLFDLLFSSIISDFSETLFFCDKLINTYKNIDISKYKPAFVSNLLKIHSIVKC